MATEQDAARDRVLAARRDLSEQLELLEASGRAAIDIPAKIRRSPAKAAAVAGGIGFLALKGPQRVLGTARRAVLGRPAPLPKQMLPDEIEKTLRSLGKDGDKVRGTIEREFAAYVKKSHRDRESVKTLVLLGVARPILSKASKAAAGALFAPSDEDFAKRLSQVRERATRGIDAARGGLEAGSEDQATEAGDAAPAQPESPPRP